jgi:hypothetical protein
MVGKHKQVRLSWLVPEVVADCWCTTCQKRAATASCKGTANSGHPWCLYIFPTYIYVLRGCFVEHVSHQAFYLVHTGSKEDWRSSPYTSFTSGKNDFPGKKFLVLNSFPTMSRWHLFRHCVKNRIPTSFLESSVYCSAPTDGPWAKPAYPRILLLQFSWPRQIRLL